MTVLDDVCMFVVVKHRHGSLITLSSDIIIRRVDGDGHQVHDKVTDKYNACTLSSELKTDLTSEKSESLKRLVEYTSHSAAQRNLNGCYRVTYGADVCRNSFCVGNVTNCKTRIQYIRLGSSVWGAEAQIHRSQ